MTSIEREALFDRLAIKYANTYALPGSVTWLLYKNIYKAGLLDRSEQDEINRQLVKKMQAILEYGFGLTINSKFDPFAKGAHDMMSFVMKYLKVDKHGDPIR